MLANTYLLNILVNNFKLEEMEKIAIFQCYFSTDKTTHCDKNVYKQYFQHLC